MSYTFSADERAQILAAINASSGLTQAPNSIEYEARDLAGTNAVPLYQTLSNLIATKLETPSAFDSATLDDLKNAKLWLDVAIGANGGEGMHSVFIRTFTDEQGLLRLGSTFSEQQMQHASNVVARNVANGLLFGDLADDLPPWTVPRIDQIAGLDASAIGEALFRDALGLNDTATSRNAGWSGTLGFNLLGGADPFESWRLMSAGDVDSERRDLHHLAQPNRLDDFKNILFAVHSYGKALKAGYLAGGQDFLRALAGDTPSRDALVAQWNIMMSSNNVLGLVRDVAARSPTLGNVVSLIADIGPENFLDMLMGATTGQSLLVSTTAANFASKAHTFFNAYGTTLQTMGAQLMPTNAAELAALARADSAEGASTRAALAGLSIVRVDVSVATEAQYSLYDPATGQGRITQNWIDDRAAFTAVNYQKLQGLGGIVQGSQNIRYFDADSGTEVLVGAGSAHKRLIEQVMCSISSNEDQYAFKGVA